MAAVLVAACGGCANPEPGSAAAARPALPTDLSGPDLYAVRCAQCHDAPEGTKAPPLAALRQRSVASVMFSMLNGPMRNHADDLSIEQRERLAAHVAGTDQAHQPTPAAWCDERDIDLSRRYVTRWGLDVRNTGALATGASAVTAANVGRLTVAWAFGLPHSAEARSQPAITGDTLFVAAAGGDLFALDRFSGCLKWHATTPAPPRTALTLGTLRTGGTDRAVLFFGDAQAHANAVDPRTGEWVWRVDVAVAEHSILTGAPVQHADRLIVPVSMYEVALARHPEYECCRSHGAVHSLDAGTGQVLWTAHMTAEAEPQGVTSAGTRRWGPSGVAVWSTPTVDPARGVVYVGTGQNASAPATEFSDAVLALDLATGVVVWHFQALAGDTYNDGCVPPAGSNCPSWAGPDHDIGASVVLTRTAAGRDVLVVGQKSGDVYLLDPDDAGRVIWRKRVGHGSALGGVHWGLAVAHGRVFAPVADPALPFARHAPGLYALDLDTGARRWEHSIDRGCETTVFEYMIREELYPECSFYYGLSAAATAVNDVVFAPALDGRVRAFAATDGAELWRFETARPFDTVNGVEAHGGSIDVSGVQAAGRMVYVQSGYSLFGELPGNVLLAFELPATTDGTD